MYFFLLVFKQRNTMNSSNVTFSPRLLWYDSTASTLVFITPIVNLLISTTCLIVLNTYLKKLHRTFKIMLNIILIHNTVLEIGQVSFNVYLWIAHSQDFFTCTFRTAFFALQFFMTVYFIALMSFLR